MTLLGVCLTACDKPVKTEAPKVAPPPQAATGEAAAPAPAPAPGVSSQAAAANHALQSDLASANPELYLKTLTELLNAWVMSKNTLPKDLDEFVKAKMIPKLPTPPPGKKLAIDQKGMRVVLVDQ